jgi:uncharacterized protein (UPF0335 family)
MEETLKLIIDKLDRLEEGQKNLVEGVRNLELRQSNCDKDQKALRKELGFYYGSMMKKIEEDQMVMRKELGFYYGSIMKKLDEVKTELKSDFNHIATTQKQHQDELDLLNRK